MPGAPFTAGAEHTYRQHGHLSTLIYDYEAGLKCVASLAFNTYVSTYAVLSALRS